MKTSIELNQSTVKELAALARSLDITGWHEMRKADLVDAILAKRQTPAGKTATKHTNSHSASRSSTKKSTQSTKTKKEPVAKSSSPTKTPRNTPQPAVKTTDLPKISAQRAPEKETNPKISDLHAKLNKTRGLSGIYEDQTGTNQDQFVLLVRDPFWLHVYWKLCSRLVERAKAAMGYSWHTAVPILRLFRIVADGVNNPRRDIVRDIRIHSEVNNWYVDVQDPPGTFQVEIGFLSREGNFFLVASSNIVQTSQSQVISGTTKLDGHWDSVAKDIDRIYTLSGGKDKKAGNLKTIIESQTGLSMSLPLGSRFGPGSINSGKTKRHFEFTVNADINIYGQTDPSVQIFIRGEPVRVANDGSFSVQYPLTEKRQVYPVEAKGSDGIETQQVILAIDRNTKILETVFLENEDED